ncbi:MAG TPA: malto-oligosyltrehalose trehalohydrolase [Vicinamibacteria bacterium]|nr:malto-oligosyltrehalose trehalohydrolase [Vicinamibacteria bacterium]
MTLPQRRLPVGAEILASDEAHFRVWAPRRHRVEVALEGDVARVVPLSGEGHGYFSGHVGGLSAGALYKYRLDGVDRFPDPASRFQPEGPHGPSQIVDPAYRWRDAGWKGLTLAGQVVYEMHIGTFTPEGTWAAAERELPALRELGVTVLEVMPVAEFSGRFGWGYDGVGLFAPTRLYGPPDSFRAFVDAAHAVGLGVILDVVYNHLGPDGNYLPQFSDRYFTDKYGTEWGAPLNYDGEDSAPVREFVVSNALYWITEFHLDGLRLDATQSIHDHSSEHVLAALAREARRAAGARGIILIAENEPQETRLVAPPDQGGYGLDGLWNDDLHHSAMVALTGHNEAYYTDYRGAPQEFVSAAKYGYLYQGQRYRWQGERRGTSSVGLPRAAFVSFIQNHDQVANSPRGQRVHELTSPGRWRALTAFVLLGPGTPMLFQGQEYSSSQPFLYFADHTPELAKAVRAGRQAFLGQFRTLARDEWRAGLSDPADPHTFERCRLDHAERERHPEAWALHRDLLRLRREDAVIARQGQDGLDGAVLGPHAFVLRFFGREGDDRLLVVNLGTDLFLSPAPEPLLAPPGGRLWVVRWSSEARTYGGGGTFPPDSTDGWRLPGEAAVLLAPEKDVEEPAGEPWSEMAKAQSRRESDRRARS